MTEKTENLNTGGTTLSPLEGEGLRGDGTAKWYVIHTYSGYENKVKTNIEKMESRLRMAREMSRLESFILVM